MKPTRDTAYLTIAACAVSMLALILLYVMQAISFTALYVVKPWLSFMQVICFAWLMIFVIGILKYTNEKSAIVNLFIIYMIYSVVSGLVNMAIGFFQINSESLIMFYQIHGAINMLVIICLVIMAALLRATVFKLPLLLFALSELFVVVFYMAVPMAFSLIGISNYVLYIRYMGLVYLIVPSAGIYIAITALNALNSQPLQKPFYDMEKPDWSQYDKPNL
ncbi:hypothetical protein SAMN05192574_104212 [Mucilaginibacter gossypiicola]|uniref:Uncharacterized protein n=1 Tax=Mucilaginibacter gossypiicola TaxID=551995 RepID=A0A1H8JKQ0_9SPHI|nr:hypothetical protein [Mucilaginibacter gossypiicola]SEN80837.1 hypothetical protein SAMN05192574_104212 [Mucilaginibacter gossypiicola]